MNETEQKHKEMVKALMKTGEALMPELTPRKVELFNIGISLAGEVGELLDCLKKYCCYNHKIDYDNFEEEMGDIEFYMEALRNAVNVSRATCLMSNLEKLSKRYEGFKYSNEAAKERKDKITEQH